MAIQKLPSRFQIGDTVAIKLGGFTVDKAEIIKVHFTNSKVFYDLGVEFDSPTTPEGGGNGFTRLYNIDSALVTDFS